MRLRPSDLYAQLLRPVGVCGAKFAFSDVCTEHAVLLRFYDTFSASDSVVVSLRSRMDCTFGGLSFGGSPFGGRIV